MLIILLYFFNAGLLLVEYFWINVLVLLLQQRLRMLLSPLQRTKSIDTHRLGSGGKNLLVRYTLYSPSQISPHVFWILSDPKLNIYFVFLLAWLNVSRVEIIFAVSLLKNQAIFQKQCCKESLILQALNCCMPFVHLLSVCEWRWDKKTVFLYLAASPFPLFVLVLQIQAKCSMPFYGHMKLPRKNALANELQWIKSIWTWSVSLDCLYMIFTGKQSIKWQEPTVRWIAFRFPHWVVKDIRKCFGTWLKIPLVLLLFQ